MFSYIYNGSATECSTTLQRKKPVAPFFSKGLWTVRTVAEKGWANLKSRREKICTHSCQEALCSPAQESFTNRRKGAFRCPRCKEILRNLVKFKCGDHYIFNCLLTGAEPTSSSLPRNYFPFLLCFVTKEEASILPWLALNSTCPSLAASATKDRLLTDLVS